jgi:hypothetical protein
MSRSRWLPGPGQLVLLPEIERVPPAAPVKRRRPVQQLPARIPTHSTRAQSGRPAVHAHGPTRARAQQPGQLHGAAPTRHQVRHVPLLVEQLDDGRLRFSLLRAPDAAWVVSRPQELPRVIQSAFVESQIASYADWRGTAYDASVPTYKRHKPQARSRKRCDVYSAQEWRRDPDRPEVWISPKGLRYSEDRQVVQRVIAQLEREGVPVQRALPQPKAPTPVTSMTARRVQNTSHQQRRGKTA